MANPHETATESYFGKFSGLRTTNYLQDNYSIEISQSQENGRRNYHAFILSHCHICRELVKLQCLEIHGRKMLFKKPKHYLGLQ